MSDLLIAGLILLTCVSLIVQDIVRNRKKKA